LFICRRNDGGDLVKVVDFGIAKLRTKVTVTQSGVTMGTPCYMSLEQAKGAKEVDERTDIYSLGVILYELLAGARPYPGENYNEVLYNLFTTEPVPLDTLRPGVPAGLCEVVNRAMAREARNRFETAAAFADALVPFAGRPVTPLQSQVEIEVAPGVLRSARATVKSPVSLTSMETTPRPIPVTATPQRRGTMNTDAFVRTVIPGRARRMGIVLLVAAIITGPLAYTLWWYMSQGWRQPAGGAAPAHEVRAPAALQPAEKAATIATPARTPVADAAPPHVYQAPVLEPAPVRGGRAERAPSVGGRWPDCRHRHPPWADRGYPQHQGLRAHGGTAARPLADVGRSPRAGRPAALSSQRAVRPARIAR
jgi:serine/threonine-protein kinase